MARAEETPDSAAAAPVGIARLKIFAGFGLAMTRRGGRKGVGNEVVQVQAEVTYGVDVSRHMQGAFVARFKMHIHDAIIYASLTLMTGRGHTPLPDDDYHTDICAPPASTFTVPISK
jgi:hypothetical protein